jgi:hypothetical protein
VSIADDAFEKALIDPSAVYTAPADVLEDDDLSDAQKLEVLRRWEVDAREKQVAEEEGMGGGERSELIDVEEAINALQAGGGTV